MGNETVALTAPGGAEFAAPPVASVPAALDDLYRSHYAPMVRLAHLVTGSNEGAEDVVQEAFVRLHRTWGRAENPDSLAWLWPDAVAAEVGGRPALYRPTEQAVVWSPGAGVVLMLSTPARTRPGRRQHLRDRRGRPTEVRGLNALDVREAAGTLPFLVGAAGDQVVRHPGPVCGPA